MVKNKKNLTDYIETILNGTQQEKEQLQQSFFKMADTGELLKKYGIIGSDISVSYGVISRHNGKDNIVNDVKTVFAKDMSKELERPLYKKMD